MKYVRSRPWGTRGPWFSNRAGSRRRGHLRAETADSGDDLASDLLTVTGVAWDGDLFDAALDPVQIPDEAWAGIPPLASAYHGHIDESGMRALHRRSRSVDAALAREPSISSALETMDSVLRRRDAITLPGRKSA